MWLVLKMLDGVLFSFPQFILIISLKWLITFFQWVATLAKIKSTKIVLCYLSLSLSFAKCWQYLFNVAEDGQKFTVMEAQV